MKKIIFILIVALLLSGSVFAHTGEEGNSDSTTSPSDNLTVKLQVTEDTSVAWFIKNKAKLDNWTTENSINEPAELSADKLTIDVYPSVNTNRASAVTIYVYGTALVNGSEGKSRIPLKATGDSNDSLYNVTNFDGGSWSGTTQDTNKFIKFEENEPENGFAKRVLSPKVTLSVDSTAYSNAAGYGENDPYEATLTMTLEAR